MDYPEQKLFELFIVDQSYWLILFHEMSTENFTKVYAAP